MLTRSRSWRLRPGLPLDELKATVERFNGFARTGVDEDFRRGESAYDRYYGDPTNKPNPNLGEISHPPYYAAKMVPGDVGTKGGIRTDMHARTLRDDGSVIEGLYAAGIVSAPVIGHAYPGPGGTIGPGYDVRIPGGATHQSGRGAGRGTTACRILLDQ
jgi:3-oxosteroid 1-dehydrogenase